VAKQKDGWLSREMGGYVTEGWVALLVARLLVTASTQIIIGRHQ
jgi:hypothetical protein